ncbi:MAG: methionine--tRNA ligase [Spirochaetes bacterium RBG_13_51_14]|nr:MAG: methionine--tRNA ligase [Spirochaetes bacterium RBG_13_51_14]
MKERFYVTTPIYYVNAEPHIGHAYTTILADFMSRFYGMLGYDSYFLTGTDEHGDKINQAARTHGTTPQEYADRISGIFRQTWTDLGIRFNDFIRTTEKRHVAVVQALLQRVYDKGDIYFGSYGGFYCVGCERFFTEKEMVDGACPDHGTKLDYIEEKNYFFKMSRYQDWLIGHIEKHPDFIRPERYRNEVTALLKSESLEDLCISRPKSRLQWGITLPFDENYVTYVWFDALINYISALGYPDGEKFTKYWPVVEHIIAKDIVKPHGIFWPTMLKSAGIEPYRHLNVHGYWNMQNAKMSKSLGNVVTPADLVARYGNDQIRYFFLREMNFGHDAKFSEEIIVDRINFDLANDWGNLVNRLCNMVFKYFGGAIPPFDPAEPADRDDLTVRFRKAAQDYIGHAKNFQTSIGLEKLWEYIRYLNKYIDSNRPWQLAKEKNTARLSSIIRNLLEAVYGIAVLLSPALVGSSEAVLRALGTDTKPRDMETITAFTNLDDGQKITDPGILFPRLERGVAENDDPAAKKEEKTMASPEGVVDISEFAKIDIRVAKILTAARIDGSDKLLELKVDSGLDERTIIAGIAAWYAPEALVGKKILLVANLKPATIFKRTSNGMLMAATHAASDRPILIEIDDSIPAGSKLG